MPPGKCYVHHWLMRPSWQCDEKVPCSSCTRWGIACSLGGPTTTAASPAAGGSSAGSSSGGAPTPLPVWGPAPATATAETFSLVDFSLYHHYMTSAAETMYSGDVGSEPWVFGITDLATRNPYLLREILAISAIHLHLQQPDSPEDYKRLAQQHHARALNLFREALGDEKAPQHSPHLFACSVLMFKFYISVFDDPASLLFSESPAAGGMPEWLAPLRGCAALVEQFSDSLKTGPIGHMLQAFAEAGEDREPARGESADQLQLLDRRLQSLTSAEDQAIYQPALENLRKCFAVAERGDVFSLRTGTFKFPATVSAEFVQAMSQQRRPSALVVMAHWCVLLNRMPAQWWMQGVSSAPDVLDVIRSSVPPDFAELLQWPAQQIVRQPPVEKGQMCS